MFLILENFLALERKCFRPGYLLKRLVITFPLRAIAPLEVLVSVLCPMSES